MYDTIADFIIAYHTFGFSEYCLQPYYSGHDLLILSLFETINITGGCKQYSLFTFRFSYGSVFSKSKINISWKCKIDL